MTMVVSLVLPGREGVLRDVALLGGQIFKSAAEDGR